MRNFNSPLIIKCYQKMRYDYVFLGAAVLCQNLVQNKTNTTYNIFGYLSYFSRYRKLKFLISPIVMKDISLTQNQKKN